MFIDFILKNIQLNSSKIALISNNKKYTYKELYSKYKKWNKYLIDNNIKRNSVIAVKGKFNANSIGLMLALIEHGSIYVPISFSVKDYNKYLEISQAEYFVNLSNNNFKKQNKTVEHKILLQLKKKKHPGLILFSSGTTGDPKAAVHDLKPMLKKYQKKGKSFRSLAFLLFDHIGGFNTVMYNISNGGMMVTLEERSVDEVCSAIEEYELELLPTSPSFINMILFSRAYENYDLSSLKIVTYGTEPMPKSTLEKFNSLFPDVRMKQTYGLSEVGIMRTKSESSDSLWMKVGGDKDHQIKVVDGYLWIKSKMAMLGYLNAKNPFDENGWLNTEDKVEVKEDYLRILGRDSDIINVGGEKVYPSEVESTILEMNEIKDCIVTSEENPILGEIVVCKVALNEDLKENNIKNKIKKYCNSKLEKFKVPVKIYIKNDTFNTSRFKRKRN